MYVYVCVWGRGACIRIYMYGLMDLILYTTAIGPIDVKADVTKRRMAKHKCAFETSSSIIYHSEIMVK